MVNEQPLVNVAFIPDLEDEAIVFTGSGEALLGLSQFLAELPDLLGDLGDAIPIAMFPFIHALGNTTVFGRLAEEASGMRRLGEDTFEWGLSPETTQQFAELVGVVAESSGPSQQFLNTYAGDEVVVIVSKGVHDLEAMLKEEG